MAKDRNKYSEDKDAENGAPSKDRSGRKSKRKVEEDSDPDPDSDDESRRSEEESKRSSRSKKKRNRSRSSKRKSRRKYSDDEYSHSSSSEGEYSDSGESYSDSESGSKYSSEENESEEGRRRRKRKRREEREKEKRRRRKEKEKRRRKERDEDKKKKKKKKKKKDKKKDSDRGKKGAVTNSWGKYGILRETDMWNKRPEFTAWLAEVKKVNLESLPNWEEKQMFKAFMEDHNTATFPSKKYYNLDAYFKSKLEKEMKKGIKNVVQTERTVFNDEEQRRQEMLQVRERQKEEQVEALKLSMQSGMAQAMKEQAQLKEEMAYQYKLGNFEAAAAIQRRLDPDVPM